jgi:hypothetical protein
MADNPPPVPNSGSQPPLPSSGMTGRLSSPTTHLPIKKGGAGKIVVMLSSVAKPPPAVTQALSKVAAVSDSPPKLADPSQIVRRPPPLPPKQVTPGNSPQPQARLSATTYVQLPPKTSVPRVGSLSGTPETTPPPLPVKSSEPVRNEPKKSGAQHIPPIKLNELSSASDVPSESIFPKSAQPEPEPKPQGWKSLEAGELHPEVKGQAAPLVAPPLLPPSRVETPASAVKAGQPVRPPPLAPLHVAPPLLEKAPELPQEKLPPPHLPAEARKSETSSDLPESSGVYKVPALIQPEASSIGQPLQALPSKPLLPPSSPVAKVVGSQMKKSTPIIVSSTSPKIQVPRIVETKPALKSAVLPKRSLLIPREVDVETPQPPIETPKATEAVEKLAATVPAPPAASVTPPPEVIPPVQPSAQEVPLSGFDKKTSSEVLPVSPIPEVSVPPTAKAPLPLTRAARAKKRRVWETAIFYFLFAVTIVLLLLGALHFGRDTRVEGQVIPPPGMTLNKEVWIVTDFSSLASGIADDLAKERTPLMQEIQEKQDHVQRAQADVAAREERIRLIQQEIQASKDEINSIVKKSRDDTQKIWDGDGAQIDDEYQSHFNQLKQTISDRAKSLNLKYEPDPSFPSPEVWANAYRLALYGVPTGVDSVKELQWLGDQMKQWRDFLKTLDDRKEQLREKAAQLKLEPAPKITDLNTKMDGLQQRIDGTTAEEVPLKAELQQAQADLATAQTAEAGLDDKYYKQLDALPEEAITKHIPLATNGRFTWVDDDVFAEGEKERRYWVFARATRADGRQYWALHHFGLGINQTLELIVEPTGFISTKAILRPDLSPEEQEQ